MTHLPQFEHNMNFLYKPKTVTFIHSKFDSYLPKKNCVICFDESPLKMMKNAFYFILKVLFVLKIFKFLSSLLGHEGKTA